MTYTKLILKKFAKIKKAEIELSPFILFIGDNNSGKSYLMTLIYGLIKYYDSRLRLRNRDFSILSISEQEELSGIHRKVNISDDSLLGKLFGYFFDN